MRTCENCRTVWPDDQGQCMECGRMFQGKPLSEDQWQARVLAQARQEMQNEAAVRRGSNNVTVHPEFMANLKESLQGVVPPSEQVTSEEA